MASQRPSSLRSTQAGLLAWVLPGAGHWFLGHRGLAVVFFAAITLPYLAGLAMGGVKWSVNPQVNSWLFMAEMAVGGYTTGFYFLANALADRPEYVAYFPSSDVAQIYLATAGLLNVLAILDAIARAQTAGLPVFYHEIVARQRREEEQA